MSDWPTCQYGDWVEHCYIMPKREIKAILLLQAKETFAALQVPDASSKIEWCLNRPYIPAGYGTPPSWTSGWKVTIPMPAWQRVLDEHSDKQGMLKRILKTRKRLIPIALNGTTQMIPRNYVRDYLRLVAK